jgi:hypothetical protein
MRLLLLLSALLLLIGCGQTFSTTFFDYEDGTIPYVRDRTTGDMRPVTQEEMREDPCYWCARVINQDPDNRPYDCNSDCPCENAYSWRGPLLRHTGTIHDNGTFALYSAEDADARAAATSEPKSGCIPVDKDGRALVTLLYSMKYPCDSLAYYADSTELTASLSGPGNLNQVIVEQSYQVDTLDLVPNPCCLQENECILSRAFQLQFTPMIRGNGQTSSYTLSFTVDHDHDGSHDTGDWSTPHDENSAANLRSSSSNNLIWDHAHEYTATVSFCTYSISVPLDKLPNRPSIELQN